MKFDTIIIALIFFTFCFLFFLMAGYEKEGSFVETVQISLGLKERNNGPKPENTLVAPFAEANVKPFTSDKERNEASLPVNKIPLNKPHRSIRHVSNWLTQHVGNALILDKEKIKQLQNDVGISFTPEAFEEYKAFGKSTNIFSAIFYEDETSLTSYLKEEPLSFSSGEVNGNYQWEFEMFMVLNLVKGKLTQYKGTSSQQQLKEVYFCVTAVRANDANRDGLLIGSWKTGRCR